MGERTGITWTDHTFNPWWGCAKVSQGCKHCYAETLSARFHGDRLWGVGGDRKIASEATWREPLKWDRVAAKAGVRRRVFCASMADVLERHADTETNAKLDAARARLWALIEATPNLDWQLLTKRPGHMARGLPLRWLGACPSNVSFGISLCGDNGPHSTSDDSLLWCFKGVLVHDVRCGPRGFISYEPAIGPPEFLNNSLAMAWINWIIVGGESGPGARPFNIEWARAVVEYGKRHKVAVFVKQLGAQPVRWPAWRQPHHTDAPMVPIYLDHKAGAEPLEWAADLRVQQFPEVTP
jgi:protein gp37